MREGEGGGEGGRRGRGGKESMTTLMEARQLVAYGLEGKEMGGEGRGERGQKAMGRVGEGRGRGVEVLRPVTVAITIT